MIGVAVIGAGHWGPNLIGNLDSMSGCRVFWVVEKDSERREQVEARFDNRIPVLETSERVFQDKRIVGVVIATPTGTHFELAKQALEAGKHVMVEKPLARTSAEAEQLCRLAQQRGLVLMVGHVFLYNRAVRYIKEQLDAGVLGRLMRFDMGRTNLGPIRTDVNAAWDLMPHDLSMLRYWIGADPISVLAGGGSWLKPNLHDSVEAILEYPGNIHAVVRATWLSARKNRDIEIVGDRQMLFFDDNNPTEPVRVYDKGYCLNIWLDPNTKNRFRPKSIQDRPNP